MANPNPPNCYKTEANDNEESLLLEEHVKTVQKGIDDLELFDPRSTGTDSNTTEFVGNGPLKPAQIHLDLFNTGIALQAGWGQQVTPSLNQTSSMQGGPVVGPQSAQCGQASTGWGQNIPHGPTSSTQPGPWRQPGQAVQWIQQPTVWGQPTVGPQVIGWGHPATQPPVIMGQTGQVPSGTWVQPPTFGHTLPLFPPTSPVATQGSSPTGLLAEASSPPLSPNGVLVSEINNPFVRTASTPFPEEDPYAALRTLT
ncbi:soluble scavenger receptor cysteine-rich domain-containing protein SSC5D-like [Latimeria chalumnae]|uniref:soluble scavenger receptor cysteine-rich domain-containing protein SSC5D-like n=1 Tax=Latimeria chalumnae TaxID=7897 RepID=UPI00313B01DA